MREQLQVIHKLPFLLFSTNTIHIELVLLAWSVLGGTGLNMGHVDTQFLNA
jgi:hypothetical protein